MALYIVKYMEPFHQRLEYSLTEVGAGFKTVLASLENWGNQYIDYMKAAGRI